MRLTERKIIAILRERGYKLTPQRRAVLKEIAHAHRHLGPAEIYQRVKKQHPGIGLVTVYRTLGMLSELGAICEMYTGGNSRTYSIRKPVEHHHHLICSDCGTVVDFTDCGLSELEEQLARKTGFKMETHFLELIGRCPDCQ